jgi:myosin heavy chain 9/10/11/14
VLIFSRDTAKVKCDTLERELQQAKEQLDELTRTATDYSNMIQKREAEIEEVSAHFEEIQEERNQAEKAFHEIQLQARNLEGQLEELKSERTKDLGARSKLQKELDDLRSSMAAKTSEETRRREVQRSQEKELTNLRAEVTRLKEQYDDTRMLAADAQKTLSLQLEETSRKLGSVEQSYKELQAKEQEDAELKKAREAALADAQRHVRSLESEVQGLKKKLMQVETELSETAKSKEVGLPLPILRSY